MTQRLAYVNFLDSDLSLRGGRRCNRYGRQPPILCGVHHGVVGQQVHVRLGVLQVKGLEGGGGAGVAETGVGIERSVAVRTSWTRVGHAEMQDKN